MAKLFEFLAPYLGVFCFLLGVLLTVLVWLIIPAKKPHASGDLFVIHYPNGFKELYLRLADDIETFENDPKVCFDVKIEDRTE